MHMPSILVWSVFSGAHIEETSDQAALSSLPVVLVRKVADKLLWGHMSIASTTLSGNSSAYVVDRWKVRVVLPTPPLFVYSPYTVG